MRNLNGLYSKFNSRNRENVSLANERTWVTANKLNWFSALLQHRSLICLTAKSSLGIAFRTFKLQVGTFLRFLTQICVKKKPLFIVVIFQIYFWISWLNFRYRPCKNPDSFAVCIVNEGNLMNVELVLIFHLTTKFLAISPAYLYTISVYIRIHFIRISRLKFAKF